LKTPLPNDRATAPESTKRGVTLLDEEQGENAETFGERHREDGLHEDPAGGSGVAADGFDGVETNKADAACGGKEGHT
jgi:hypothetical protein